MAADNIVEIVRRCGQRLREAQIPVKELVLYGSCARGTASPASDIDVMVLLDDAAAPRDLMTLWLRIEQLSHGVDARIETWPVTLSRFQNDDVSPLILTARHEGVRIAA